jgi:hypothetical protein
VPAVKQLLGNLVSIWSIRPEVLMVPNIRGMVMIVGITGEMGAGMTLGAFTVATTEGLTEVAGIIELGFLRDDACR